VTVYQLQTIIHPAQALAEVGQSFRSDPNYADKLRRTAREVSPFQSCPTSSAAQKVKRPKRPLDLSSPYPQKFWMLP